MVMKIKLVVLVVVVGYLWKRSSCRKTIKLSKITSKIKAYIPRRGESLEEGFGNVPRKIGIKLIKEIWT